MEQETNGNNECVAKQILRTACTKLGIRFIDFNDFVQLKRFRSDYYAYFHHEYFQLWAIGLKDLPVDDPLVPEIRAYSDAMNNTWTPIMVISPPDEYGSVSVSLKYETRLIPEEPMDDICPLIERLLNLFDNEIKRFYLKFPEAKHCKDSLHKVEGDLHFHTHVADMRIKNRPLCIN